MTEAFKRSFLGTEALVLLLQERYEFRQSTGPRVLVQGGTSGNEVAAILCCCAWEDSIRAIFDVLFNITKQDLSLAIGTCRSASLTVDSTVDFQISLHEELIAVFAFLHVM